MGNRYTVMVLDDDGAEHEFHVQANGVQEARDDAEQEARECGLRPSGATSVQLEEVQW